MQDSATCNSNQKWNNDKCHCLCKECHTCKKDYSWNPNTCICENSRHLESILDDSVIVCDEIINVAESVSTNVTNTIPTVATNTMPRNVVSNVRKLSEQLLGN